MKDVLRIARLKINCPPKGISMAGNSDIHQKCTNDMDPKKLGRAFPAASYGQNPKEQQFFLGKPPLKIAHCTLPCL